MSRFWTKRGKASIYAELGRLLAAAFAAALLAFLLLNGIGIYLIDTYLEQSNYLEQEDNRRIQSLQRYVTEHDLSTLTPPSPFPSAQNMTAPGPASSWKTGPGP